MNNRKKILTYLIILAVIDIVIPIPVLGLTAIYVVIEKPAWFRNLVEDIYSW